MTAGAGPELLRLYHNSDIDPLRKPLIVVCLYIVFTIFPVFRLIPKIGYLLILLIFAQHLVGKRRFWYSVKKLSWLWVGVFLTFFHLMLCWLFDHGYGSGVFFYRFARAVPFIFFGFVIAWANQGYQLSIRVMAIVVAIASLISGYFNYITFQRTGISSVRLYHGDTESIESAIFAVGNWSTIASYVYMIILILILVLCYRQVKKKWLIISVFVTSFSILISSMSVPVILLFMSLGMIGLYHTKRLRGIPLFLLLTALLFLTYQFMLIIQDFGPVGMVVGKIIAFQNNYRIGMGIDSDPTGRLYFLSQGLSVFITNPIIGVGARLIPGKAEIGMHSTFVDWPAQFGIVGAVGPLIIFGYTVYACLKIRANKQSRKMGNMFLVFWLVYFINCIMNPTFLSVAIDFIAFLTVGINVGYYHLLKIEKKQNCSTV